MTRTALRAAALGALLATAGGLTLAQNSPAPAPAPAPSPAPEPKPGNTQQVEITGARESDTEARRQSTAAKIVIGREEIERFGDSTVGEVLKRLPGVTISGPAGRGGAPRMRGLGAGYTQILIDGQRVPPGFSIESLTPDQIERIEILRAPTAETGARAIGGTINIITREGYRRRINDLRVGFATENGQFSPGLSWTRNDSVDNLIYNLSASAFRGRRESANSVQTVDEDPDTGALVREQVETNRGNDQRVGVNATGRLQWRLGQGDTLILMPVFFTNRSEGQRRYQLTQSIGPTAALYDHAATDSQGRFTVGRLNTHWRSALGSGGRLELNGGIALARGANSSLRQEFDGGNGLLRTISDDTTTRDRTLTASGKFSKLLENEHSLVGGAEVESLRRTETRVTLQNGAPLLADFGDAFQASSLRMAAYLQDEWAISPHWSAHAGLRSETIRTRGDAGDVAGSHGAESQPRNASTVVTPLLHAVWKPDPRVRDQMRFSLTRSYKSPTLQNLVARPSVASRYPVRPPGTPPDADCDPRSPFSPACGGNIPTSPDRGGNPELRPELATGVDVAIERYLKDGGVLSANVFRRRLKDYIRNVIALENVGYSAVPRYVSRPQNIGGAITQGVELEAKFRLDQALDGALPVEIRSNLSLFRSKVDAVPGPDNRLDQQPKGTANLGADYRIRGTPLTVGGSLNLTPGYRTRLSEDQVVTVSDKRQFDAYALWVFNPGAQLRLLASNLTPEDYVSTNTILADNFRTRARSVSETYVNWQLRLELKL